MLVSRNLLDELSVCTSQIIFYGLQVMTLNELRAPLKKSAEVRLQTWA